jgi:septum formation topological specificity factor MinE
MGTAAKSYEMPWLARRSLSRRFSSAMESRSLVVVVNISLRRSTSCSRALMYISLRSRCVLNVGQYVQVDKDDSQWSLVSIDRRTSVLVCSIPVDESKQVYCQAWDLFFWEAGHLRIVSTICSMFASHDIPFVCFLSLLKFLRKLSWLNGLAESF